MTMRVSVSTSAQWFPKRRKRKRKKEKKKQQILAIPKAQDEVTRWHMKLKCTPVKSCTHPTESTCVHLLGKTFGKSYSITKHYQLLECRTLYTLMLQLFCVFPRAKWNSAPFPEQSGRTEQHCFRHQQQFTGVCHHYMYRVILGYVCTVLVYLLGYVCTVVFLWLCYQQCDHAPDMPFLKNHLPTYQKHLRQWTN